MMLVFYCVLLAILASYQAFGDVNLQLDTESTTCAEGTEIVDQRVCPQQGFVCMTNTGILLWQTSITTVPASTLHRTGEPLNSPATIVLSGDGTELFVTALTGDDSLGNLTSTLTITDSYNIATATVTCSDGIGAGDNMDRHVLLVVTSMPSAPDIMYSFSGASCTLPGTADVTVSWQCPVDTGATVITGFPVSVNGTGVTTASGTDNFFLIPGLALGETHDIAVAASNCLGTGADSQVQVSLPDTPFPPVNLAVVRSSCDQLTVTWQNDARNGDLPCPVTGIAFDYTINGGGQSLTPLATDLTGTIDIADNIGTYDITVSYVNGLGFNGGSMSLSVYRVRSVAFIDSSNTIQVGLDNICTGDYRVMVNYGLSSGGLDMNSACVGFVMDLAQVPLSSLMARQSYSYTYILYRGGLCDGTFLERSEVMMFTPLLGCSSVGLVTSDKVTITPNQAEYRNTEGVTYGCCGADKINGPARRTCQNGVWAPPLTEETSCSNNNLSTGAVIGITIVISSLVAFVVGGLVVGLIVHYCHLNKQRSKYSPKAIDSQQHSTPMYEEVSSQSAKIEMRENLAYGQVGH